MDEEALVALTADIVSSHVANNNVAIGDVGNLVKQVHEALAGLGQSSEPEAEARQPAISVRASVKPDAITCLICGKNQKTLKRHIGNAHGLTPAAYRTAFGLPATYPMVAPSYSVLRSELAKTAGLGRRKGSGAKADGKSATALAR